MAPRVYNYRRPDEWKHMGNCAPPPVPDPPEWLQLGPEEAVKWREEWSITDQARRWAVFFPDSKVYADTAKMICEGCAVKTECLMFALATHQDHGVWGGLTETERERLRRRRIRRAARELVATS